ncbi:hypothetical protein H920_13426 [Fukomys damarensis]|uniref:Uncharacterized protein n=1 Tax=Fukomys damarensis TaxID=885580 RepID=A0A091D4T9_FUKDA|nr:hypothetical protein H920_13426 [Fukomys damarensis]
MKEGIKEDTVVLYGVSDQGGDLGAEPSSEVLTLASKVCTRTTSGKAVFSRLSIVRCHAIELLQDGFIADLKLEKHDRPEEDGPASWRSEEEMAAEAAVLRTYFSDSAGNGCVYVSVECSGASDLQFLSWICVLDF